MYTEETLLLKRHSGFCRRWWQFHTRLQIGDALLWRGFLPSRRKGFTIEGENNGQPDRSKRDSGGKYVLGRLYVPSVEGRSTSILEAVQRERRGGEGG